MLASMRIVVASSFVLAAAVASAAPARLSVTSDAFVANEIIPTEYTCDGAAKAPTLTWSKVPAGTKTIAILVDNPDADGGPFTHMLVTNLDPSLSSLELGGAMPAEASTWRNGMGAIGYLAPCPEDGRHHYHFRVYALDARVGTTPASRIVGRTAFLRGIAGHVLAEGELVGEYEGR